MALPCRAIVLAGLACAVMGVSIIPMNASARLALMHDDGVVEQMCEISFNTAGSLSSSCSFDLPASGIAGFAFRPRGSLDPTTLGAGESDLWRVDVSGKSALQATGLPIRASPRVILDRRCSVATACYRFRLALPPATARNPADIYRMDVFLEQFRFSDVRLRSDACSEVRAPTSLHFSVAVRVQFRPTRTVFTPSITVVKEEDAAEVGGHTAPKKKKPSTGTGRSSGGSGRSSSGRSSSGRSSGGSKRSSGGGGGRRLLALEQAEDTGAGGDGKDSAASAAIRPAASKAAPAVARAAAPGVPPTARPAAAAVTKPEAAAEDAEAEDKEPVAEEEAGDPEEEPAAKAPQSPPSDAPPAPFDNGICQHIPLRALTGAAPRDSGDPSVGSGATGWYALGHDAFGDVATWHWQPASGCGFDMPTATATMRRNLAGRWIAFVGDLTLAEMAISVLLLADVPFDRRWAAEPCSQDDAAIRAFDTGPLDALGGGRVTMFWAASVETCGRRSEGVHVFADAAFEARFLEAHKPEAGSGRTPHTIVFNSGLHDLAAQGASAVSFGTDLSTHALPLLRRALPTGRLIWRSTSPKTGGIECFAGGTGSAGNAGVDELNDVAWRVIVAGWAAANGGSGSRLPPLLLDANALLRPFFEPGELARHHCSSLTRDGEQTISRVRSGCLAVASALSAILDHGSASATISGSRSPTRTVPPSRTGTRTPAPTRSQTHSKGYVPSPLPATRAYSAGAAGLGGATAGAGLAAGVATSTTRTAGGVAGGAVPGITTVPEAAGGVVRRRPVAPASADGAVPRGAAAPPDSAPTAPEAGAKSKPSGKGPRPPLPPGSLLGLFPLLCLPAMTAVLWAWVRFRARLPPFLGGGGGVAGGADAGTEALAGGHEKPAAVPAAVPGASAPVPLPGAQAAGSLSPGAAGRAPLEGTGSGGDSAGAAVQRRRAERPVPP